MNTLPDKINLPEPDMSTIRRDLSNESAIARFFHWRTGRRHFNLNEDWIIWIEYLQLWVKLPKGFVFDGASVPKIFHSFVNSVDALFYGSVVHDFIYRTNQLIVCDDQNFGKWYLMQNVGKNKADLIMFHFSKQMEGIIIPNAVAYSFLSVFGTYSWYKSRKEGLRLITANPSPTNSVLTKYN